MNGPRPYRVIVAGSRDWTDQQAIRDALDDALLSAIQTSMVVVHGACRTGADAQAARWVADLRATGFASASEEAHPADWHRYGRAAGPVRNAAMVAAGADICLAFIRNDSRGASHTARIAEAAGIPTRRWTA